MNDSAALESLQRSIPEAFAPGLTKLCKPSSNHRHAGEVCKTPGKRPLMKRFTVEAIDRYRRAREGLFDVWAWADEVSGWLAEGLNVGLVPPLGVVALDCDTAGTCAWARAMIGAELLRSTPEQVRGTEKAHLWLRYDPDELPLRASQLRFLLPDGSPGQLDLRVGGRSQAVVAPSRHPSEAAGGEPYVWARPLPASIDDLPMMPAALARALAAQLGLSIVRPVLHPRIAAEVAQDAPDLATDPAEVELVPRLSGPLQPPAGHDLLRGYVNRLCRYTAGTSTGLEGVLAGIRERAGRYAESLYGTRDPARLAGVLARGGELDKLITTGWARFGGAAPLAEDKTDQGSLDLLAATSGEDWRYLVQSGEWVAWDETRGVWARGYDEMLGRSIGRLADVLVDDALREQDVERRARLMGLGRLLRNNSRVESALRRAQKAYALDELELDARPWLVTFPGALVGEVWYPARVLDLETGALREPRREDLLSRAMGAPWIEGAVSPDWESFLESSVPDEELRAYLARAAGLSLAGTTLEHVFFFLHGPGGTGKSTLLNALADAMGDLGVRCDVRTFAEDSRRSAAGASPDVARLKGARLAVCSEIPDRARLGARMKDLTGGDRVLARAMYGRPIEFAPSHTVWVAGNCEPQADWMDTGVWRRLRQIPLERVHGRADATLPLRLGAPLARAAVAQWIVRGWRAYQAAGGLGSCAQVDAATADYRARLDPLADWLAEGVRLGAGEVPSGEAWGHYCAFMDARYGRAGRISQRQFGLMLAERGVTTRKGAQGVRILRGLTLVRGGVGGVGGAGAGFAGGGTMGGLGAPRVEKL